MNMWGGFEESWNCPQTVKKTPPIEGGAEALQIADRWIIELLTGDRKQRRLN
jgi:hypothetical protein